MLGASGIQVVLLLPSMPLKTSWLRGTAFVPWKPLARAQVLASSDRLLDTILVAGGVSLTVTTTRPAAGAIHSKVTSSKSPGKSGREVNQVPSKVPPAAGSPR